MPDGRPSVTRADTASAAPSTAPPPRGVADLIAALADCDEGRHGQIEVHVLTRADGSRVAVVDIAGTKSWDPLPNHDATSPAADLRAIRGAHTAYEDGVLAALRAAGVQRDEAVMLVGHSEGGLVALNLATRLQGTGPFRITHVITAGAPIAALAARVPAEVQVLAIENSSDVVPRLDGADNPDRVNVTTASVHHPHASIADSHGLRLSYLPGARDIDASGNRSVRDYLAGAHAFLDARADSVTSVVVRRR